MAHAFCTKLPHHTGPWHIMIQAARTAYQPSLIRTVYHSSSYAACEPAQTPKQNQQATQTRATAHITTRRDGAVWPAVRHPHRHVDYVHGQLASHQSPTLLTIPVPGFTSVRKGVCCPRSVSRHSDCVCTPQMKHPKIRLQFHVFLFKTCSESHLHGAFLQCHRPCMFMANMQNRSQPQLSPLQQTNHTTRCLCLMSIGVHAAGVPLHRAHTPHHSQSGRTLQGTTLILQMPFEMIS